MTLDQLSGYLRHKDRCRKLNCTCDRNLRWGTDFCRRCACDCGYDAAVARLASIKALLVAVANGISADPFGDDNLEIARRLLGMSRYTPKRPAPPSAPQTPEAP